MNCSFTNASFCTSCLPGYILNDGLCLPDLSCNLIYDDCISCPIGYITTNGYCTLCALS